MSSRLPTTLTILPTYNCTAACENCCFGSHPGIAEQIPLDRILSYIDQAASLGSVRLIVFSGGECFTLGEDLVLAVRHATGRGLATRCVTNAYWATSEGRTRGRLAPLAEAGLGELNVSTGDFHRRWVPSANAVRAARGAVRLGIRTVVVVETTAGRSFTADDLTGDPLWREMQSDPGMASLISVIESPWISMDEQTKVPQQAHRLINRTNLHLRSGCDSVLNTVVVTPGEQLGACCGLTREQIPELQVGSLREAPLAELYRQAATDFLKIWIFVEGPERILAWAAGKDPEIEWEGRFTHHCDACRFLYHDERVRRVIERHYRERVDDVLFRFALIDA